MGQELAEIINAERTVLPSLTKRTIRHAASPSHRSAGRWGQCRA